MLARIAGPTAGYDPHLERKRLHPAESIDYGHGGLQREKKSELADYQVSVVGFTGISCLVYIYMLFGLHVYVVGFCPEDRKRPGRTKRLSTY